MSMHFGKWALVLIAIALAGCAAQPVQTASSKSNSGTVDYAKYVQETVPWFHFGSLYSWDSQSPGYVVVWTSPVKAYRLTLVGPCIGLSRATASIGLTSHGNMVNSNQDAVIAGGEHCRIMRIEQLDARAIRAARDNKKTAKDG